MNSNRLLCFLYYAALILLFLEAGHALLYQYHLLPQLYASLFEEKISSQLYGLIMAITMAVGVYSYGTAQDEMKKRKEAASITLLMDQHQKGIDQKKLDEDQRVKAADEQRPKAADEQKQRAADEQKKKADDQKKFDDERIRGEQTVRDAFPDPHEVLSKTTAHSRPLLVKQLQILLEVSGQPTKQDGNFGQNTEDAVRSIQKILQLPSDGKVGSLTWNNLREYLITSGKTRQLLERLSRQPLPPPQNNKPIEGS